MQTNNDAGSYNPLLPAIFPIRVGALLDIATVSFAASLIQYKLGLIRKHSDDDDELKLQGMFLRETPETDLASVPLPTVIRESITALLPTMHESLDEWEDYHYWRIFWHLDSCEDIVSEWLDEIVWMSNGTINYGQTAEKMLHSGKMGAIEKFRLACVYCFEDIVRNVWSTLDDENSQMWLQCEYFRKCWGNGSLMFDYWYSMMINESSSSDDKLIAPFEKLIKSDEDNFNAIEYLWNHVGRCWDNRNKNLLWIISEKCNPLYMWRFLIGLNASEFDEAIQLDDVYILGCFAEDSRFEEVAITIWRYMLERIVDTGKLVGNFEAARGVNKYSAFDYEHETHLIQLMWHYAPEPLRLTLQNVPESEYTVY